MAKIVLIGAGSYVFGTSALRDLFAEREVLRGSTVVLVDIDVGPLHAMLELAERLNITTGNPFSFQATTDRRAALPSADFVIISVAVRRMDLWKLDFQIPLQHGVKQVWGENGGPGGLFHAMRNIPIILDICRDIERIAPEALVINFSNPEGRLCLAATRFTKLRFIGLCHGIDSARRVVGCALNLPVEEVDPTAAGLNHLTWLLHLRRKSTGEDLYPAFKQAMNERLSTIEAQYGHSLKLSYYLMQNFGFWPSPSDDHVGEYLSYAWEFCGLEGFPFDRVEREAAEFRQRIDRWRQGTESLDWLLDEPSGERAVAIIAGILGNSHHYELAVNLPNAGYISNLPAGAIVEVPAIVDANGVHGISVGDLPEPIAAICRTQVAVIDRVVEAGVHGDRAAALQALLLDPVVQSAAQAEAILTEMLTVHADYLPQFKS